MPTWIAFSAPDHCSSELAKALAPCIHDPPDLDFVPFLTEGGWHELSNENDHKLDYKGCGVFTYRDRYRDPARVARIILKLTELGATNIVQREI